MEAGGLPALLSPEDIDALFGDVPPGAPPTAENVLPTGAPAAPPRRPWPRRRRRPPPPARVAHDPGHLPPPATGSSNAVGLAEAPQSREDKRRRHRAYQQRYRARSRSDVAEAAAALEAGRAAVAAAAAERAALLERGQAVSAILDYTDGVVHAFSALRCAPARAAPLGLGAPEVAADQPHALGEAPPEAVPMLRVDGWTAAIEVTFRRLAMPSDAVLRAGARFAPTRRLAEVARFTAGRVVAVLAAWAAAPPAERPRVEAALEALIDVRRRFLAAVLAVGRARDFTVAIAHEMATPGETAVAQWAIIVRSLCLAPAQRAALLEVRARFCAAVKAAREELRAAVAHAADAATAVLRPEPCAGGADAQSRVPPAPGFFNSATHAAALATRAADECAEAEAVAVVEATRAVVDVLTPLQLAVGQRAVAPHLVDVVRLLDAVAKDAASGAGAAQWAKDFILFTILGFDTTLLYYFIDWPNRQLFRHDDPRITPRKSITGFSWGRRSLDLPFDPWTRLGDQLDLFSTFEKMRGNLRDELDWWGLTGGV